MIHFRFKKDNRGFTLIETLIVILILAIIAFTLTPVIRQCIDVWILATNTNDILAEGRLLLWRMTKELRNANSITAITPTSVSFTVPGSAEIVYSLSANSLHRLIPAAGQDYILAKDISSFSLTYLARDSQTQIDPATGNPADVWEIHFNLSIKKGNRTLGFQSSVSPRNLTH